MARILVRYNTKVAEDPEGRSWRVLREGVESLARKVQIEVPCETISEPIATGELKHHFLCLGEVEWSDGHVARIVGV